MQSLWYNSMMLAFESNSVINLRLAKIGRGGAAGHHEAWLMIDEKVRASVEAVIGAMTGTTAVGAVARYRDHVAANQARLSP